jgi:hypothetical protein
MGPVVGPDYPARVCLRLGVKAAEGLDFRWQG